MQVKLKEFEDYRNMTVVSNTEDGFFAVQYALPSKVEVKSDIRKGSSWSAPEGYETYEFFVKKPTQREVRRTVVVVKTSANCYKAVYADIAGCALCTAKTYEELHKWLKPLWQGGVS